MTDFKASDQDVSRAIRSWLHEDRHEDVSRVAGAVLDRVEATPQRRSTWWPVRRLPVMNKFVTIGLGVAAVVVVLFIGAQLGGTPSQGGPSATQSAAPSEAPSSAKPSSPGDGSLPVGSHVMVSSDGLNEDRATVNIPAPGWYAEPDEGSVTKDDGEDYPVTVVTVPGDHYQVPRDMCDWQTDPGLDQNRFAGTVDELVAYLSEQTYDTPQQEGPLTRELSTPVDITIDGTPGKSITGGLPGDPLACDEQRFCSLLDRDGAQCLLLHERNQIVTLWISQPDDRNPPLWVVAGSHFWTAGSEVLAEMNAIVDSMTILHE